MSTAAKIRLLILLALVPLLVSFSHKACAGGGGYRKVFILPHVEESGDFFTGLSLLNTGKDPVEIAVTAYTDRGSVTGKGKVYIAPGERFLGALSDILGTDAAADTGWIRLEFTGHIKGFGLLGNDRQLATLPLKAEGKSRLVLPYVLSGDGIFTELYVLNTGSGLAYLNIVLHGKGGEVIGSYSTDTPLVSGEKFKSSLTELFGRDAATKASWLTVESDGPVTGLALVGDSETLIALPMD